MNSRIMLQLDFILLNPNVVQAVVDVYAAVLGAEPHGGLVGGGRAVLRGLPAGWRRERT